MGLASPFDICVELVAFDTFSVLDCKVVRVEVWVCNLASEKECYIFLILNMSTASNHVYIQLEVKALRITYFLLALAVLSLNLSFFGVRDSLSLESAEEGESGESRRNLSSLRA